MNNFELTLPIGFAVDDKWYRNACIHPLRGTDEEAVAGASARLSEPEHVSSLLVRCLTRLGPLSPVSTDDVRALAVGDREALILHLRRLTFGNRIQSVLTCPDDDCGETMDLELAVDELLLPPSSLSEKQPTIEIPENGDRYNIAFRLPTGADQEAIAAPARNDIAEAMDILLRRCILEMTKNGEQVSPDSGFPDTVAEALSEKMAELDPQAEILLNLTCPSCGHKFPVLFDAADYFFRELTAYSRQLYDDIHVLALHYHWAEKDILNMSSSKRKLYLHLIAETYAPEET